MTIADALSKSAKKAGLSDVQIAAAVGVSEYTVTRWRRGDRRPGGPYLLKLMQTVDGFRDLVDCAA